MMPWVWSEMIASRLETLPYLLTIVALAGFIGKAVPPAADGLPYDPAGSS
jgi:simple sugar transport system permease protein